MNAQKQQDQEKISVLINQQSEMATTISQLNEDIEQRNKKLSELEVILAEIRKQN